ncbi:MAG: ABC transporter permease [Flavobacteriales bacterium]
MVLFDRDTWDEVYEAISKNKFRTFLTMIGVGWGMFLFVTLLGLARGMQNGFDSDLKGAATNSMFVWTQQTSIPYKGFQRGRTLELRMDDMKALQEKVHEIKFIAPRSRNQSTFVYGTQNGNYRTFGDRPEINKMFKKKVIYGRFINQDDISKKRKVCVIGKEIWEELYPKGENAINTFIKINNVYFNVIGIYENDTGKGFEGENSAFIPFDTFQQLYNMGDKISWMAINVKAAYDIREVEIKIKDILKKRHNVHPEDSQAFGSFNLGDFIGKITGFMKGMQLLTMIVGVLTLFAGVIAISSILLITVKERTKEFGIRRALGAVPSQIRGQIIIESIMLASIAGIGGVILATTILYFINTFLIPNMEDNFPFMNATVDLTTLGIALIIMVTMAMLAGLLPAQRAISIKPIDALRDE